MNDNERTGDKNGLIAVITSAVDAPWAGTDSRNYAWLAEAILGSDWIANRDAGVAAAATRQALENAADDWEQRPREVFSSLLAEEAASLLFVKFLRRRARGVSADQPHFAAQVREVSAKAYAEHKLTGPTIGAHLAGVIRPHPDFRQEWNTE